MVANSSAPLVGLVDTWVIGHLPSPVYLAAVGVGAAIFNFIYWSFGFLRMSTTGLIAQAHGKGDTEQLARIIIRSIALALSIALLLLVLQSLILSFALSALSPTKSTLSFVEDYFHIRIWSAPASLFIFTLTGFLIGTARATAALALQLILNVSNGLLNLVFVLGFDMGVSGIALGSLMAEWLAACYGFYLLVSFTGMQKLITAIKQPACWNLQKLSMLLSTNGYIFARTLLLIVALGLVTRKSADLGTTALAATQILSIFTVMIALGLDAFAYAAEALTGAAYGRRSIPEFRFWSLRVTLLASIAAIFYSLVFLLFGNAIVNTLTNLQDVRAATLAVLPIMIWMPLASVWCYQFDGIYVGATAGKGMLITITFAFIIYVIALYYLSESMGLKGIWLAILILTLARAVAQAFYYPALEKKMMADV